MAKEVLISKEEAQRIEHVKEKFRASGGDVHLAMEYLLDQILHEERKQTELIQKLIDTIGCNRYHRW